MNKLVRGKLSPPAPMLGGLEDCSILKKNAGWTEDADNMDPEQCISSSYAPWNLGLVCTLCNSSSLFFVFSFIREEDI